MLDFLLAGRFQAGLARLDAGLRGLLLRADPSRRS
jgi:hypothetical protein